MRCMNVMQRHGTMQCSIHQLLCLPVLVLQDTLAYRALSSCEDWLEYMCSAGQLEDADAAL